MRSAWILLVLFLLALTVRLAYLSDRRDYEFNDRLELDPRAYDERAAAILRGEDPTGGRPDYQAPLYPYFLAAVYRVAGRDYDAARAVQALLGALTVVWTAVIGGRLFRPSTGRIAGLVAALYAPFPFYEAQIMKSGPALFLVLLGCFLLLRFRSPVSALLAGVALGGGALLRENTLLFLAAAAAGEAWGRSAGRGSLRRGALVLLGGAIAVAPVTLRNHARSGDWILITSQGGQNFYIGNNPAARGTYTDLPFVRPDPRWEEEDFRAEAFRRIGRELPPAALSRYWYGEAFRWMAREPARAAALWGRKALLFWNRLELPDNENFYYMRERFAALRVLPFTFGVIAPFALLGMAIAVRRFRRLFLLYAGVGVVFAALVAFFLFSRYRLGAVPFLILFAAHGGERFVGAWRERRFGAAALLTAGLLTAAALVHLVRPIDFDPRRDGYLPLHVNRAMLFAEQGQGERAAEEYAAALEIAPDRAEIRKRMGAVLARLGRREEAIREMQRAAAGLPADGGLRNDLALLLLAGGEQEKALVLFREAVRVEPGLEAPHRNLARLLEERGEAEEAAREMRIADSLRTARGGR
ncbi:MAG: glycosyltransferase family 39 protein [Candidatus Eisenbacteria bacterium]|nr:glycosyltransferase family 39 protein [Candidatus Eisenbacteria bacterium]